MLLYPVRHSRESFLVGYANPLNGVGIPHSRHASHHSMVGYAYINPLTGLTPSHGTLSYHVMAGYAYINPLAGLRVWVWGMGILRLWVVNGGK